ncbi:hypothetical protein PR048_027927 [Dryococelus australis]|uniref:RNA-directed DNA polymerase n=1 Tax=Dryococelus australis TaxID=614101 RepID=A0ABQ9GHV2_9NEOP|nr:hypothetical protein PR048_027927 [Dryococelus australis]
MPYDHRHCQNCRKRNTAFLAAIQLSALPQPTPERQVEWDRAAQLRLESVSTAPVTILFVSPCLRIHPLCHPMVKGLLTGTEVTFGWDNINFWTNEELTCGIASSAWAKLATSGCLLNLKTKMESLLAKNKVFQTNVRRAEKAVEEINVGDVDAIAVHKKQIELMVDEIDKLLTNLAIKKCNTWCQKWDAVSGRVMLYNEVTKKYIMADEKKEAGATLADESVGTFVMALHLLAEKCEYKSMWNELIRDKISSGTFRQKAKAVRKQQLIGQKSNRDQSVEKNNRINVQNGSQLVNSYQGKQNRIDVHSREVQIEESVSGAVGHLLKSTWRDVQPSAKAVEFVKRQFKIDTGADITVVTEQVFGSRLALKIQGQITTPITWRGNTIKVDVYVVQGLKEPLLGWSAIESLGILNGYSKLFEGLGLMAATYTIRLKNDAVPVSLHAPRRVALPLQPKLKQEIDRLVNMGIISPVDRPTEWCSGIVIVPKQNGQIRLCVDLTVLNTSVLPAIDDSLVISSEEVEAITAKIEAIRDMPQPQSVTDVRRLLGMVNYVGKFVPNLAEITEPIRQLLKERNTFLWEEPQELAFKKIKHLLCSPPVLLHYDPNKDIRVGVDATSYGIGAVLEQQDAEGKKHSQIEMEALALTWACDRFYMYILGKYTLLITDHQPLVSILGNKNIDELPPRLQRYRMRPMRYTYQGVKEDGSEGMASETHTGSTIVSGILMKGVNMVIHARLRKDIMDRIHLGHLGIKKCTERAKATVWWPGIMNDIKNYVTCCKVCVKGKNKQTRALVTIPTTLSPMGGVRNGLGRMRWDTLPGIPREVQSDNGPQYSSQAFKDFAAEYWFSHVTSNARYAQSNGQVEATIKNVKYIVKRSADPYLGLLSYRNISLSDLEYSPAQLLMGRSLRDTLPATYQNLQPKIFDNNKFTVIHDEAKSQQKAHFDRRHRTRERFPLQPNHRVWITDLKGLGKTMLRENIAVALEEQEEDQVQWRSLLSEMVERQGREEGGRMKGMANPAGSTGEGKADNTCKNKERKRIVRQVYYLREGKICCMREVVCREVGETGVERTKEYENKRELVDSTLKQLFSQPAVQYENVMLRKLLDNVVECTRLLKVLGQPAEHWDSILMILLSLTSDEWLTFAQLTQFLEHRTRALAAAGIVKSKTPTTSTTKSAFHRNTSVLHNDIQVEYGCARCKGEHTLHKCPEFASCALIAMGLVMQLDSVHPHDADCVIDIIIHCCIMVITQNIIPQDRAETEVNNHHARPVASSQSLLASAIVKIQDSKGMCIPCQALLDSGSERLELADPTYTAPGHIDVVLGADIYPFLLQPGHRTGTEGSPVAIETYLVKLPFREDDRHIGESRSLAVSRLHKLERQLKQQPDTHNLYHEFMDEYLELGHMQPIPVDELERPVHKMYCIPHMAVMKESSNTTKLRVVFDASAKISSRISLNGKIVCGEHEVPLVADITKMHCQIYVHDSDIDYQRIVWRPSPSDPIQDFRLCTVTYGGAVQHIRNISEIAKVFDPLGWRSPVTIRAKLLLQFLKELGVLKTIKIGRRMIECKPVSLELVGFCDASEAAYAAAVYLSSQYEDGSILVCMVAGKTWVAPVKQVSSPWLDLCGAVLLSRLLKTVKDALNVAVTDVVAYTDSTIVLVWLASPPRHWKTFVANRVAMIQDLVSPSQWHHVDDTENPADCASCGIAPTELPSHPLWLSGPGWLQDPVLPCDMMGKPDYELVGQEQKQECATGDFASELQCLKVGKPIPVKSRIACLCPFLDEDGVLRVGGRLTRASIPEEQKHPAVFPKHSKLAKMAKQVMGSLPAARVRPARPFLHCGMDYAGPLMLCNCKGRSNIRFKFYVALFVCFATKAVHLELVSNLTTPAFTAALKQAALELKELGVLVQSESHHLSVDTLGRVRHFLVLQLTSSTPPGRPMGEMYTVLMLVEACLNSRPLTAFSSDPSDFAVLTPGHFLTGGCLTAVPDRKLQHRWSTICPPELLSRLQNQPKCWVKVPNLYVDDLVILKDERLPAQQWKLGSITKTFPGEDGLVRTVAVKTATGEFKRPVSKSSTAICALLLATLNAISHGKGGKNTQKILVGELGWLKGFPKDPTGAGKVGSTHFLYWQCSAGN